MSNLLTTFLTHSQRVCRLYKPQFVLSRREHWPDRLAYQARFDTNKKVEDLMKAKRLLIAREEELKKKLFSESPSGIAENRFPTPDDALDIY